MTARSLVNSGSRNALSLLRTLLMIPSSLVYRRSLEENILVYAWAWIWLCHLSLGDSELTPPCGVPLAVLCGYLGEACQQSTWASALIHSYGKSVDVCHTCCTSEAQWPREGDWAKLARDPMGT